MTLEVNEIIHKLIVNNGTHGRYSDTARLAQDFRAICRSADKWSDAQDVVRESLDMIATKMARILSGNDMERDHWVDIAGYAMLIVNLLDTPPAVHPLTPKGNVYDTKESDV